MGKSLKGKELGKGISQRKDGLYQARFTNRFGKRETIYGKTISEITKKMRDAQYEDDKQLNVIKKDMTLDEWFDVWMQTCKKRCRDTTRASYTYSYNRVREDLGWRKIQSINTVMVQDALNKIEADASRRDTKWTLVDMFNQAVAADLVLKNVVVPIDVTSQEDEMAEPRVLTREETELFLQVARHYRYYDAFRLALETGMRIGEILGLKWSDIDFGNRTICINRTLVYVKCQDKDNPMYGKYMYDFHSPKTKQGKRKIPMTLRTYMILKEQRTYRVSGDYVQSNEMDNFWGMVFTTRNGKPISPRDASTVMGTISKRLMERDPTFKPLTPHTLRHTFATRCIESGMQPKTLQVILGHSSVNITMNLYCHVTEDTMVEQMKAFEALGTKPRVIASA